MATFPGFTLWTDAWIADTKHLTRCARGTYHDLLVVMWRTPNCRVPDDDAWLAAHLNMRLAEVVNELRPIIVEFCQIDGNRMIYQKRLMREYVHRLETHRAQSLRAKHPRKHKKILSPELAENHAPAKPPTLPLSKQVESTFFPTAAHEQNGNGQQQDNSAGSFATAPNGGALAHPPDTEQAEPKRSADKDPRDKSLANIRAEMGWNGFRRPT